MSSLPYPNTLFTLKYNLPEASLEYWRERKELLSLEIAVGMSGCDTVLSRLPLVRPHRSQRDLRSASKPATRKGIRKKSLINNINLKKVQQIVPWLNIDLKWKGNWPYPLLCLILGWTWTLETRLRRH